MFSKCSREEFIRLVTTLGPKATADQLGISVENVYQRRRRLQRILDTPIVSATSRTDSAVDHAARLKLRVDDGYVLIGSDCHYWPGLISTAHHGFVSFAKTLKPQVVILNGDVMDFPSISRHSPIMWENRPKVIDEIESAKERLTEIEKAAPGAKRIWTLGNHDARFESRLAAVAPEYLRVTGVHLKDHFPLWMGCWSCWINGEVIVKHRFKGGMHAPHNNTLWAGKTIVTGHLHSQKVYPLDDYNGTRWGVDGGTMADPFGPQFEYQEDNPRNHRSGFVVLRFVKGELLQPQIARVVRPGVIDYCGELHAV